MLYVSPEQFKKQPQTHKTDIWGLGTCIYEACALQPAFNIDSIIEKGTYGRKNKIKYTPPLPIPIEYGYELTDLIMRMLDKNPENRPSALEIYSM